MGSPNAWRIPPEPCFCDPIVILAFRIRRMQQIAQTMLGTKKIREEILSLVRTSDVVG
jgi:hypothetical protein